MIIQVEVARTPQQIQKGLQNRRALPPNCGMLFVHSKAAEWPYWMYRVNFPLDIIWLDENQRIVSIAPNVQPCPTQPCPDYRPSRPACYVLELAAGTARKLGLQVGQVVNCEEAAA